MRLFLFRSVVTSCCAHNARSVSSYFHRPGSEPLRYGTLADMLQQSAHAWPDRVAVRSVHQDKALTYSQLLEQADALACGLARAGLARGDRLGVWAHNCVEWVTVLCGACRAGVIPVAMNPAFEEVDVAHCISKVGMRGIVVADKLPTRDYMAVLRRVVPELATAKPGQLESKAFQELKVVISLSEEKIPGCLRLREVAGAGGGGGGGGRLAARVRPGDGALIHFTSGTTGQPKAALVSHFSAYNNTHFLGQRTTLHHGHQTICVQVPIFHAFGSVISVLAGLAHGATLLLPSAGYSAAANLRALLHEGCTVVHGTPTMFVDAVGLARALPRPARPRLRVALTAGAPCSPQLFRDMQSELRIEHVKSLYGMTETTAAVFQSMEGETMEQVTETVGFLQEHLEVKVVDDQNRMVEMGQPGELLVRGYNVMMGYWGEPEKTKETIGDDGWLRTGDRFTLGSDGYGTIVGRVKDLIIRGGENIAPKEIEDVLNMHPDVAETHAFGVSDPRLGEEICVAVRTRTGSHMSLEEVLKHCKGRLSRYKVPRIVKQVDDFPKTASGKVQKYKLKEMVENGSL